MLQITLWMRAPTHWPQLSTPDKKSTLSLTSPMITSMLQQSIQHRVCQSLAAGSSDKRPRHVPAQSCCGAEGTPCMAQRLRSRARLAKAPARITAVVTQYAAGLSRLGSIAREASACTSKQHAHGLPKAGTCQHRCAPACLCGRLLQQQSTSGCLGLQGSSDKESSPPHFCEMQSPDTCQAGPSMPNRPNCSLPGMLGAGLTRRAARGSWGSRHSATWRERQGMGKSRRKAACIASGEASAFTLARDSLRISHALSRSPVCACAPAPQQLLIVPGLSPG